MAVPTTGLVAYYKLDEATGTRFDSVGSNNLIEVGGPHLAAPGIIGSSVQLPVPLNVGARLEAPDNPIFNPTGDFTIGGWAFIEAKTSSFQPMISKGRLNAFQRQYFLVYDGGAGDRFEFTVSPDNISLTTVNSLVTGVPLNTFTFVVAWHDATAQTINIQINDGAVDSLAHLGGIGTTTRPFVVGGHATGLFGWPGRVDETFVYNRVLSAAERTLMYNGGLGQTFVPVVPVEQTIDADTSIITGIEETDFEGIINPFKSSTEDEEGNVESVQTTPVAPTLVSATTLATGDQVRLIWTGGGPFYNTFFKKTADVTFIKANQTPLPGTQTQYDVGGLDRDTSYDFQVSSINGAGVETF